MTRKGRGGREEHFPSPNIHQASLVKKTFQGEAEAKTDLRKLPDLNHDKAKTESIAQEIVNQLGDQKSFPFYYLVASKVPEREIYATLSSLKQGGATSPAKVFASRMKSYAAQQADIRSQSLYSAMQDMQKKMTLR